MYQKFIKKSISIIVALTVATSLFAGCGKSEEIAAQNSSEPSAASVTQEVKKEPVELTLMSFDVDKVAQSEDAPLYKQLKEKLNIKIKIISSPWNNYTDKLNVAMASGSTPDIFSTEGISNQTQYKSWIKEGFLLPLSDAAVNYPNLSKQIKKFEAFNVIGGGKLYGLPISAYLNIENSVYNDHSIFIRKDWLDNLGLSVPATIDEFYNVAKAFTTQDPDKNGKNDTYGYTSASDGIWWHYPIFNAFGTSFDKYKKVDGKWVPELLQDETKQTVAFLKKLYDEKIMDPEFMINTGDKKIEKFVSGKAGIMFHNGSQQYTFIYDKFKAAYPDKDPKALFTYAGVLQGKDSSKRLDGWPNFWMFTCISNQASDEKKTKALELLDYLASDEGMTLMRWGIEGEHYKKEGDKFVNLIVKNDKGNQQAIIDIDGTARLKNLITWDNDFVSESTPNREDIINCGKEGVQNATPDPMFGLVIDDKVVSPELSKTVSDYMTEALLKIIVKSKDFDKDWNDFVSNWLSKGGQKIWDETNKKALEEGR